MIIQNQPLVREVGRALGSGSPSLNVFHAAFTMRWECCETQLVKHEIGVGPVPRVELLIFWSESQIILLTHNRVLFWQKLLSPNLFKT